jgi:hypothetical protein
MTALYIRNFKRANKCPRCKEDELSSYSLCPKHLEVCKLRFRKWAAKRRALGKCVLCNKGAFKGELKCKKHKEINRKRIAAWMVKHPNQSKEAWQKRLALRAQGICYCYARGKLEPGQRRCPICITRRPEYFVFRVLSNFKSTMATAQLE